ncbi:MULTISPECIES: stage III sporulation protein AA [Fictibacillus]|uniref:Stage III sporulation protein AA n=1 Tax=Fictibacillus enclensis TaxID=1017270 RepID=A0A0V8JFA7_9BACL|nr:MULTISPECIES: stage III sporulation protein AA [Fictibacillus]KSU85717.1 stage III sporulation protein AA [Fictibacillus enclensis]RXY98586.1 stage III sporulation protein AA [Fictibacillus sp. S7]SCC01451.1 stage III sporulation protein AA [Fictibacillus enclensis]
MEQVLAVLPEAVGELIMQLPEERKERIEEIRFRLLKPLELIINGRPEFLLAGDGPYIIQPEDGVQLLNKLSRYSLYALEEELKRGYITIKGGHRVGLAGKVITEKGEVKAIRDIGSYNIRIARQKIGSADRLVSRLYEDGHWLNTLIVGAPQTGKTTLLRDLARTASAGCRTKNIPSSKVGIVDERSEIAGSVKGIPQFVLGERVDVLDACPKAEGMMMMIRSMSPEVLIVDEIGRKEDVDAILEAMNAGVQMMMTVHGYSLEEALRRPAIFPLAEMKLFDRYVELTRTGRPGTVQGVYDRDRKPLPMEKRSSSL